MNEAKNSPNGSCAIYIYIYVLAHIGSCEQWKERISRGALL
jgi:hypothetical protein